jgi:D-galactonate transporter
MASDAMQGLPAAELSASSKAAWRLLPLLFVGYVVAYLDRVNVGFAQLQMGADLHFSNAVYGFGAGVFFIGYFLFEVPSNLILRRVGARIWIARIMITWGVVSAGTMLVDSATMFYAARFLLGAAEAGFFPGIIYYLTLWFPAARRARIVAIFMTAIAISGVFGSPLSGWILRDLNGAGGLAGWKWLFLLEGLPSVLVGVWVLLRLDDGIEQARWLTADEKIALKSALARDERDQATRTVRAAFLSPRVFVLAVVYFCFVAGLYGLTFWLPQLIKAAGVKDLLSIGLITAIPFAVGAIAMVANGAHSDHTRERRWHAAVAALFGAAGLVASALLGPDQTALSVIALTIGTAGIVSTFPVFWPIPSEFLGGAGAAAGIALINSLGNLAGFASPYMVGFVRDVTGSTNVGMYTLGAVLVIGALLVLSVQRGR